MSDYDEMTIFKGKNSEDQYLKFSLKGTKIRISDFFKNHYKNLLILRTKFEFINSTEKDILF